MWREIKRIIQLGFAILLSTTVVLVGWSMLNEAKFDLHDAQKHSGKIMNREVGKDFSFSISGSLASFKIYKPSRKIYKPSRNYDELKSALNIGDSVTVYFVYSQTANIQVLQIEKNGQIIVDKALLTGQNKVGGSIAFIGGFALLGITIWQFKKQKR